MEKGVCVDPLLVKQVNRQLTEVCSVADCRKALASLFSYLGYSVRLKGKEVVVEEFRLVKKVEFLNPPKGLSESLKTVRLLLQDKPFDPQALQSAKQLLLLRLKALGYASPEVDAEVEKSRCGYRVLFRFNAGSLLLVKSVQVEAPKWLKGWVERLLKPLVDKPVNLTQVRSLQEKVESRLVAEGYYNCKVIYRIVPLEGGVGKLRPVKLIFKVLPGKPYKVVFKGNRHFSYKKLFKLLTFPKAKSFDEFELENSRRRIVRFYRNHGFPFVKVKASVTEKPREVVVLFQIDEGPFVRVESVKLEGLPKELKEGLDDALSRLEGEPFSLKKVKELRAQILYSLKSKGYIKAKVNYTLKGDSLIFSVLPGPQFVVDSVVVKGVKLPCRLPNVKGKPYTDRLVSDLENFIQECLADRGHPDAAVSAEPLFNRKGRRVSVRLNLKVNPGPGYVFGFVLIRGLKRTKLWAVKNLLTVEPGTVYSHRAVVKQYSRLSDSRLFSFVSINDVKTDGAISEVIKVDEGALLSSRGFIGYGTDSGLVLNGFLSSTSPFGMGMKYFLFGNYRQKEGYDAVFKLLKPAFPFKDYDLSYSIVKKEQIYESFKSDRTIYSFSLLRKASRYLTQDFRFEISREKVKDTKIQTQRRFLERRLVYLQTYNHLNSLSNPTEGYYLRSKFSLAGTLLGGNTDYTLLESRLQLLHPLGSREVIALRVGGGVIRSLNGKAVPVLDRFFLGGAESVRGYKYGTISPTDSNGNFVGGKAYGLFSLELRYNVRKNVQLALFYDSGRVFPTVRDFKLSDWYSSVGFGIRYLTPVGPLRFDYGYKLKRIPGQGPGRFHISFGYPF
ncbi:BamA/OMP85 family outer membrane protein [Thermovibrio ammonificans]